MASTRVSTLRVVTCFAVSEARTLNYRMSLSLSSQSQKKSELDKRAEPEEWHQIVLRHTQFLQINTELIMEIFSD